MQLQEEEDNNMAFDPLVGLPLDIAQLIFHRMNFTARVRVPAVCHSWRVLSATLTPPPTLEQPWMLLRDLCCPTFQLVDLSMPTPSAHHRHSPPTVFGDHNRFQIEVVAGCHSQFLILSQVIPLYNCIYDPFSGQSRSLPSRAKESRYTFEFRVHRAKFSCAPTRDNINARRCMVAAMINYEYDQRIYVCRPDSDYWTPILSPTEGGICDMSFHRGRLYAIDRNGIILVTNDLVNTTPAARQRFGSFPHISLFKRSQVVLDRTPYIDFCVDSKIYPEEYLVESCGELLLVQLRRSGGYCELGKVNFKVYKILEEEVGSEERKLVPINDLGDRMLFVGKGCSRSWSGSASGFFLKNCIYFFFVTGGVGRFHLQGDVGNALLLPKFLEEPSVDGHSYCHPVWITPPNHLTTQS